MVKSQIIINVCSCNLTGCNCTDGSLRTCHAVTACKYARGIVDGCPVLCLDYATYDRDTCILESCSLNTLTDCDKNDITRNADLILTCICRRNTSALDDARHFRVSNECADLSGCILFNLNRSI